MPDSHQPHLPVSLSLPCSFYGYAGGIYPAAGCPTDTINHGGLSCAAAVKLQCPPPPLPRQMHICMHHTCRRAEGPSCSAPLAPPVQPCSSWATTSPLPCPTGSSATAGVLAGASTAGEQQRQQPHALLEHARRAFVGVPPQQQPFASSAHLPSAPTYRLVRLPASLLQLHLCGGHQRLAGRVPDVHRPLRPPPDLRRQQCVPQPQPQPLPKPLTQPFAQPLSQALPEPLPFSSTEAQALQGEEVQLAAEAVCLCLPWQ